MPTFSFRMLAWLLRGKLELSNFEIPVHALTITFCFRFKSSIRRYLYKYQEPIPIEMLVKDVCNYKQQYTQFGGLRPFGVGFVFAGWDRHYGYQIYESDPSGNYSGWKASIIGQNNQAGKSIF